MLILISPTQLHLPAGAVIRVPAAWHEYQTIANQRGDNSIPRIKYRNGEVLLMVPLPEHETCCFLTEKIAERLILQGLQPLDLKNR